MRCPRQTLVDAWYRGAPWLWLLLPLSVVFRALVAARRWAYRAGWLPATRLPVPVVVVGNITVGGTGKTPVVVALVEALQAAGLNPGAISRGYAATGSGAVHVVDTHSSAEDCGDEALMIWRRTGCTCVVAHSRVAAAQALLAQCQVDIIIADDGLQHYAMARDMEIALYDGQDGFGNGQCLPAGPLREPASRLAGVDFVLARGLENTANGVKYRVDGLVNVSGGEMIAAEPEQIGREVYALAGLGRPLLFFRQLRDLGFAAQEKVFPDHHAYRADDLVGLTDKPIIMTEKDAVKCRDLAGADSWYLKVSAILPGHVVQAVLALAQGKQPPQTDAERA